MLSQHKVQDLLEHYYQLLQDKYLLKLSLLNVMPSHYKALAPSDRVSLCGASTLLPLATGSHVSMHLLRHILNVTSI